jgi:hypothetical protein
VTPHTRLHGVTTQKTTVFTVCNPPHTSHGAWMWLSLFFVKCSPLGGLKEKKNKFQINVTHLNEIFQIKVFISVRSKLYVPLQQERQRRSTWVSCKMKSEEYIWPLETRIKFPNIPCRPPPYRFNRNPFTLLASFLYRMSHVTRNPPTSMWRLCSALWLTHFPVVRSLLRRHAVVAGSMLSGTPCIMRLLELYVLQYS